MAWFESVFENLHLKGLYFPDRSMYSSFEAQTDLFEKKLIDFLRLNVVENVGENLDLNLGYQPVDTKSADL